jgi:methylated-DNA-[protein]-cysteine S-methyltransferase
MVKIYRTYYESEIGVIEIAGTDEGVSSVRFVRKKSIPDSPLPIPVKDCVKQIDEYFKGRRKSFSLILDPEGTPFQKRVWDQLLQIPYAATKSYKDVARLIGNHKAVRAVGGANAKNLIGIIIPCHRVIAHDGTLGGYGGGLWRKKWLLRHERKHKTFLEG